MTHKKAYANVPMLKCLKNQLSQSLPKILSRIWIGLVISLFNEALKAMFSLLIRNEHFNCPNK